MRLLPYIVTAVLLGAGIRSIPAQSQEVAVRDGNILLSDPGGGQRQLTSFGRDGEPRLSPDKKWVVFVRRGSGSQISDPMGNAVDPNEIRVMGADGQHARTLVRSEGCNRGEECLPNLTRPQFAEDGNGIFFEAKCAVVTSCIYRLDLRTGVRKELGGGSFLHVIHDGTQHGNLLVIKHKYFMCGGSYDWWWVLKPNGAEVGAIGPAGGEPSEDTMRSVIRDCP